MTNQNSQAVDVARNYYNSEDADTFYFTIWGGEDIHIGLYDDEHISVFEASRRTVDRMAAMCRNLEDGTVSEEVRVLDIGAGYGGAVRYLAERFGCQVVALNLSEIENERDRQMNKEQGLDHLITVVDGNFEELPFENDSFDVVWSQDAILHSSRRDQVIKEAARVLKAGGELVFTDPMQSDDCPENVLQPIYDRIHLSSLASPEYYKKTARAAGLEFDTFEDLTEQLPRHYHRILKETQAHEPRLEGKISREYIENMKRGLQHWVDGGNNGYLAWGIFRFVK